MYYGNRNPSCETFWKRTFDALSDEQIAKKIGTHPDTPYWYEAHVFRR